MSDHPSLDALQAHLAITDPAVEAHLGPCAASRSRAARLAPALALLDEARRVSPAPPPWERMDEALAREAERVAGDLRAGRLRSTPRLPSWAATSLAVAAGVGLLLGGRALLRPPAAVVTPIAARPPPPVTPRTAPPVTAPAPTPYEGVVLLAAGGARYRDRPDGAEVPLAGASSLREGAHVNTPPAARAVITVHAGWTADLRGDSSLKLSQLRAEQPTLTLDRGEVALTPSAAESRPIRLVHEGWTVESRGPVLARLEGAVLRVVVLSGRTDVRRGEAEPLSVTGPLVIDLPLDGGAATRRAVAATDPAALDLAALSATGRSFAIPALDPSATLTLLNHGALPSALESVRLAGPGTLQARVGRTELRLDLGAAAVPQWATYRTQSAPVARDRVQAAPPLVEPAADPTELSPAALRAVSNSTARRIQHCFATCLEQNRCPESMAGRVTFAVSELGRATVSSLDASLEGARRCLVNDAQFLPVPRTGSAYDFQVGIGTPGR